VTQIDAKRLKQLIDAHGGALTLYARGWCRAPDDAVQEALIALVRQNPAPDHPVAWLYKTVRRRAMNLTRAQRRRDRHHLRAGSQRESWFLPADTSLEEPVDVERLLRRLAPLEREIVVSRIWGELSFDQIAALVGRSTSSVHRRYRRALAELARMLDEEHTESRLTDERKPSIP
jgi:RNA polymerase sigma-70 factor (ECF subfamily)